MALNRRRASCWRRKNTHRIFRFLNSLVLVLTVLSYLAVLIPPNWLWITGFLALSVPFCLIANLFFVLFWWWRKRWYALYSLLLVMIGFPFWRASFSVGAFFTKEIPSKNISVLDYNVREFDVYQEQDKEFSTTKKLIRWIKNDTSDIKCVQDFYNSEQSFVFNTREQLSRTSNVNQDSYYSHIRYTNSSHNGGKFGIAIFSKYPILKRGEIIFKQISDNGAIFVDIIKHGDTLRIYNIHLESMSINQNELRPIDEPEHTFWYAFKRLKRGFVRRSEQVDEIIKHVECSPYPVILCGDLNDLPYSYTYFKLRRTLNNAFEEAGLGTEFTFNGKLFFLRIDNQFYSDDFDCVYFNTHNEVKFSDHYPIRAIYRFD